MEWIAQWDKRWTLHNSVTNGGNDTTVWQTVDCHNSGTNGGDVTTVWPTVDMTQQCDKRLTWHNSMTHGGHDTTVWQTVDMTQQCDTRWTWHNSVTHGGHDTTVWHTVDMTQQCDKWWTWPLHNFWHHQMMSLHLYFSESAKKRKKLNSKFLRWKMMNIKNLRTRQILNCSNKLLVL